MTLFKDKSKLEQRNAEAYTDNFRIIADILRKSNNQKSYLKDFFLGTEKAPYQEHFPKHECCSSIRRNETTKLTEKRICRCMYYFNENSKKCQNCLLEKKWKNLGKLQIIEYEWPTDTVRKKIGGMDLIVQNKVNKYALEVKPKDSQESLTRMIAEILTYTQDCKYGYLPGICFFENSLQMQDYYTYIDNPDLKYILSFVPAFMIKVLKEGTICEFEIVKIGE